MSLRLVQVWSENIHVVIYTPPQQINQRVLRTPAPQQVGYNNMMNGVSEMELLRERIEENQFSCLKLYPNKPLLGRSKAIKLTNINEYFEERCMLFIEHAYLLLRVEVEERPAFLSQHTFINHLGEVYLFYSFDPAHQNRLKKILPGELLSGIVSAFNRMLLFSTDAILDCEHLSLLQNTQYNLIHYLEEIGERSKNYYYQPEDPTKPQPYDFRNEPSKPFSVLTKLEASELFKEYNFPLKYNTAVLAKGVIEQASQLRADYVRLWQTQQVAVRQALCLDDNKELTACIFGYYSRLLNYLQLLQSVYFLKVTMSQVELEAALQSSEDGMPSCTLSFHANLKKQPHVNRTSNDKSSESSVRNDKQLGKEEKLKLQRYRDYLEKLADYKTSIVFTAKLDFKNGCFEICLQAVSLWTIDEIYSYFFLDFWGSFINHWHNSSSRLEAIHERVATLRYDLFHNNNKNIGLKTTIRVPKGCNLAQELIVAYDQAVLLLLLMEPVLKKMYKVGYQLTSFEEKSFEELRQPSFVEEKVNKLGHALKKYTKYYLELTALSSQ